MMSPACVGLGSAQSSATCAGDLAATCAGDLAAANAVGVSGK